MGVDFGSFLSTLGNAFREEALYKQLGPNFRAILDEQERKRQLEELRIQQEQQAISNSRAQEARASAAEQDRQRLAPLTRAEQEQQAIKAAGANYGSEVLPSMRAAGDAHSATSENQRLVDNNLMGPPQEIPQTERAPVVAKPEGLTDLQWEHAKLLGIGQAETGIRGDRQTLAEIAARTAASKAEADRTFRHDEGLLNRDAQNTRAANSLNERRDAREALATARERARELQRLAEANKALLDTPAKLASAERQIMAMKRDGMSDEEIQSRIDSLRAATHAAEQPFHRTQQQGAAAGLSAFGGTGKQPNASPSAAAPAIHAVSSPDDVSKLKVGDVYRAPDGKLYKITGAGSAEPYQ